MSALEDLASDIRHLSHLIDTVCETQLNSPRECNRERVSALLWIDRDLGEKVKNDAVTLIEDAPQRMTGGQRNG